MTPPPPNAAAAAAASLAGGLGLFGGQRFNNAASAPVGAGTAADRTFGMMAAFAAAQGMNATAARNAVAGGAAAALSFGSNNNLFNNTKTRHNSIDRASNNRSILLEDFR